MRKLHLVGLTTDRDGLIFTARKGSKSGGFVVPLDDKVLAAIADARNDGNGEPVEAEAVAGDVESVARRLRSDSALTPREMQARLRAGRSIEEVAAEAGVDNEWVARFAVPILAEQAQVVELARSLVYAKPRLGESSQALGASVIQNLSDRSVFLPDDVANAGWSAFQLHDSVWMVRFRYRARGRDQEAQWEIDVPTGRLQARNRLASDLGYVEPNRRRVVEDLHEEPTEDEVAPAPVRRSPRRAVKADATSKSTPKVASKRMSPGRVPAPVSTRGRRPPPIPARPAAKAAKPSKSTRKTVPGKVAAIRTAAGKAAVNRVPAGKAAVNKAGASRTPAAKVAAAKVAAGRTAAGKTAAGKSPAKATPVKSSGRRRPAKADPASDSGPTAGSGGVRMAVAQVSTARVAASLASADRAPWAAAVRSRSGAHLARSGAAREASGEQSDGRRPQSRDQAEEVRSFQPRPLPAGRQLSAAARVRKVTVPRPAAPSAGPQPVSLPAPRRPPVPPEPLPVERPKRRRLRSR